MIDKSFADIKNSNGVCLKDCLTYEGQYYWWYDETAINADLIYDDVRGYGIFKSIQQFIICHFPIGLWFIYQFMHISLCVIDKLFDKKGDTQNSSQDILLARSHSGRWEYKTNPETGVRYLTSRDYEEIFHELPSDVKPLIVYEDYPIPTTVLSYITIKRNSSFKVLPLMKYWSRDIWKKERGAMKYFKTVYSKFINDDTWITECSELLKIDKEKFRKLFAYHSRCSFPLCVQHHELMGCLIADLQPSVLLAACEQSYLGRGWIYVAKEHQIPIIGLQHGVMTPSDYLYFNHSLADMQLENGRAFPTPDTMLVWGQKDAEMLTDIAGFPEKTVIPIGNPKFDYMKQIIAGNVYSKEKYFEKHGIESSAKVIIWATQLQVFNTSENDEYITDIFKAVSEIPNAVLIVKPHPLDPDKLIDLISKQIQKSGIRVILEDKNSDTIEQIYVSDILIIQNSTVGLMAVALDKPLICLDYTQNPDFARYIADGVGLGVYKGDDLHKNITSLLLDDSKQAQYREQYISQKLSKLDGEASRRARDIITNLCSKNKED